MRAILSAEVRRVRGTTRHTGVGVVGAGEVTRVEIVSEEGSWFLMRYNGVGQIIADTWHPSMDEAKQQASFEYELGEWSEVDAP